MYLHCEADCSPKALKFQQLKCVPSLRGTGLGKNYTLIFDLMTGCVPCHSSSEFQDIYNGLKLNSLSSSLKQVGKKELNSLEHKQLALPTCRTAFQSFSYLPVSFCQLQSENIKRKTSEVNNF